MPSSRKNVIATVVGARPQFIKAALFSELWRKRHREILIHTGQHYDRGMSDVFFNELKIPDPDFTLGIGSAPQGAQTGRIMEALEKVLLRHPVDGVLVYGDTNSTLAGALVAAKLNIPLFHVEAGLRSFQRRMPEEINRITADHLSTLLFSPTPTGITNLKREGLSRGVVRTGDVMFDLYKRYAGLARRYAASLDLPARYAFATVHRAEATDSEACLRGICEAFNRLDIPVVWPVHPRTQKALARYHISLDSNIRILEPVGYVESLAYQSRAEVILTDSGGVQKEAYFGKRPCVTLRNESEWVEIIKSGHNILAGTDPNRILAAVSRLRQTARRSWPPIFGAGNATSVIARSIELYLRNQ